jgi:FAD:protein FMN transferase
MKCLPHRRIAWATASAAILGAVCPASAQTYLTEAQALAAILGDGVIAHREDHSLDAALRSKLEHETNLRFPEQNYTIFSSGESVQPRKFAIVMNEIGKSEPITFMVGVTDQGKVSDVVIMVFRENRGWEVKEKRWLNQFHGKTLHSPIRVEEDIINYTGATLSSKAVARGVKRALALVDTFCLAGKAHAANLAAAPIATFAKAESAKPLVSVVTDAIATSLYRQARYAMGTICEVCLWCGSPQDAHSAFRGAFAELERLEQIFSAYRDSSELAQVNREAFQRPVAVSDDFFELSQDAVRLSRETRGLSDITVGPLQEAWRLRAGRPTRPSPAELRAALALVGCDKLRLDSCSQTIHFLRDGISLDFGGLAKGYAAQRVAQLLHERGAHAALVNLGRSSISASATNLADTENHVARETGVPFGSWLIAITSPIANRQPPAYIGLRSSEHLSTSGTTERQFQIDSSQQFFSHILNPGTGLPLTGRRSVTVIANTGTRSESLAKHLLIDPASVKNPALPCASAPAEWLALTEGPGARIKLTSSLRREQFTEPT